MQNDKNKPANPHPASTGNASNPSQDNNAEPVSNQLINKKREKYLREGGNIEDIPDVEEETRTHQ